MTDFNFEQKRVLVMGAGGEIGRQIAVAFADRGARMIVTDKNAEGLARTVETIRRAGVDARNRQLDVVDEDAMAQFFEHIGPIDIAINTAGILFTGAVDQMKRDEFARTLETNVLGMWLAMKYEIRAMKPAGKGCIVNISSNLGPKIVRPGLGAYSASKAAVSALTRTAALEVIPFGIRANCICPGPVDTRMAYRPGEDRAARDARIQASNPSKRTASTEEIAAAVLWLASDSAGYIVGQDIAIDGGASA